MPRPITDTLRRLRGGEFLDEASEALARVVQAVAERGGSGDLTIKLTVKRAAAGALTVIDKLSEKVPTARASETLMFSTPEGDLLTEDPRQQRLALRTVEQATEAPRTVAASE